MKLRQRCRATPDAQLVEDVLEVLANGRRLDPQPSCDLVVGETILNASHHVVLARRQRPHAGRLLREQQSRATLSRLDDQCRTVCRDDEGPQAVACQSAICSGSRSAGVSTKSRRIRLAVPDAHTILPAVSSRRMPSSCMWSSADSATRRRRRTDSSLVAPSKTDTTKSGRPHSEPVSASACRSLTVPVEFIAPSLVAPSAPPCFPATTDPTHRASCSISRQALPSPRCGDRRHPPRPAHDVVSDPRSISSATAPDIRAKANGLAPRSAGACPRSRGPSEGGCHAACRDAPCSSWGISVPATRGLDGRASVSWKRTRSRVIRGLERRHHET